MAAAKIFIISMEMKLKVFSHANNGRDSFDQNILFSKIPPNLGDQVLSLLNFCRL